MMISLLRTATILQKTHCQQTVLLARRQNLSLKSILSYVLDRKKPTDEVNISSDPSPVEVQFRSRIAELEHKNDQLSSKVAELSDQLDKGKKLLEAYEITQAKADLAKQNPPAVQESKTKTGKVKKDPSTKKQTKLTSPEVSSSTSVDVSKLDLRVGRITKIEKHPDASKLYVSKIDCNDSNGCKTVVSGLVEYVPSDQLLNSLVLVLNNMKPSKIRGIVSEAMILCAASGDKVQPIKVPVGAQPGDKVTFYGYSGKPEPQLAPKKKIWEQVSQDIKTNADGIATYKNIPFKIKGLEGDFSSPLKNATIR